MAFPVVPALIAAVALVSAFAGRKKNTAVTPPTPGMPTPGVPIGGGPVATFTDQRGVTWSVNRSTGTPGTNVWNATTDGYGVPTRRVEAPTQDLLQTSIQDFALVSTPTGTLGTDPGGIPGGIGTTPASPGDTSSSPTCGPYPPFVNGWRPVCTTDHLGASAIIPPSTPVELTVQLGNKAFTDNSDMVRIEGVITGGSAAAGYDIAFYGVIKQTNSISAPPLTTVFRAVRPTFIQALSTPTSSLPELPGLPGTTPGSTNMGLPGLGGLGGLGLPGLGTLGSDGLPLPSPPPQIPTSALPPLPAVPALPASASLAPPGFQHGLAILPSTSGRGAYAWSRDSAGLKAPAGLDIVLFDTMGAMPRGVFAIKRADTNGWAFYYVSYLVDAILKKSSATPTNAIYREESTIDGNLRLFSVEEQTTTPGTVYTHRTIAVTVDGSIEQVDFSALDVDNTPWPPGLVSGPSLMPTPTVQTMSFRQLADWLL